MDKRDAPKVPNKKSKKLSKGKNLNDLYERLEKIPEPPPMTQEEIFGKGETVAKGVDTKSKKKKKKRKKRRK